MLTSRRIAAVALCAVAMKFVPTAAAQAPADSVPVPTINIQISRSIATEDSVRGAVSHRVWIAQAGSEKRHTVRGAVIGGIAGAVLGAAAGRYIGDGFCDAAECSDSRREGLFVGGAIGAGVGIAIGALLGYVW